MWMTQWSKSPMTATSPSHISARDCYKETKLEHQACECENIWKRKNLVWIAMPLCSQAMQSCKHQRRYTEKRVDLVDGNTVITSTDFYWPSLILKPQLILLNCASYLSIEHKLRLFPTIVFQGRSTLNAAIKVSNLWCEVFSKEYVSCS